MRTKLIAFEIVLLVFSAGIYVWSIQRDTGSGQKTGADRDQPVYPNLNVSQIKTIELRSGDDELVLRRLPDEEQQSSGQSGKQKGGKPSPVVQATMDKGPYRPDFKPDWVVSSYHNYGVKEDQVQERIIKPFRKLKRGVVQARSKQNLKEFGLDRSNRRRIVLKDESNNVLREVVLGKRETQFQDVGPGQLGGSSSDQEYIYYFDATNPEEEFEIRKGENHFSELPLDPQEWVHKEILSYDSKKVPLLAIKNKEKLYVLRRKKEKKDGSGGSGGSGETKSGGQTDTKEEQNQSGDDAGAGNGGSGKKSDSKEEEKSWELYSGDFYADGRIARNTPLLWENNQLRWKGGQGRIESVSLTKRKLKNSEAESLASTLSSLEAEKVVSPLSVPADQNRISREEKARYGFNKPVSTVYLGEWKKPGQVLVFRAKFFVGKTDGEQETHYLSSLKTSNTVQRIMQNIAGLGGALGGGQAKQLIPVYTLSSTDEDPIVKPGDLIKKKDDKKKEKSEETKSKNGDRKQTKSSSSSGGSKSGKSETEKSPNDDTSDNSGEETSSSSSGKPDSEAGDTSESKKQSPSGSGGGSDASADSDSK